MWENKSRTIMVLTVLILVAINISAPRGQPASPEDTNPVEPLIKILKERSLYPLDEQAIKEFIRCVRKKAFLKIDLPKGHVLAEDLKIESCFPQDPHANYGDNPKDVDPKTLVDDIMMTSTFAHIRIKLFAPGVAKEIASRLQKFDKAKVDGLIVDLRDNMGGFVDEAIETVNLFSPKSGLLIVEWVRRNGDKFSHKTNRRGPYADWPMVIIVNKKTASAAEIVAGTLQIWGYKIVGTQTYGKVVGQDSEFFGEEKFSFTTAKYFFANGESPDGKGITPNILVDDEELQVKIAKELILRLSKPVKPQ